MAPKTAKLFMNGRSQAVRLPAEFRFEGDEVYIWSDELAGTVTLSSRQRTTWEDLLNAHAALSVADREGLLADRVQPKVQSRNSSDSNDHS